MLRRAIAGTTAALVAHTGVIFYRNYSRHHEIDVQILKELNTEIPPEFRVGGIDDRIMDDVRSGDIVLMRRKWFLQYLPLGLAILLHQSVFGSECDHVAVAVVDRLGAVSLVENTPFGGVKQRPFLDRLRHAGSELVILEQLTPRERKHNIDALVAAVQTQTLCSHGETAEIWLNLVQYAAHKVKGSEGRFRCANMQLLERSLDLLGVDVEYGHEETASLCCLEEQTVHFRDRSKSQVLRLPPVSTMLRTR